MGAKKEAPAARWCSRGLGDDYAFLVGAYEQ